MSRTRLIDSLVIALGVFVLVLPGDTEGQPLHFGVAASVEASDNRDATATDKESNIDFFLRPYAEFRADTGMTYFAVRYQPGLRYRTEPGDTQDEFDLQHQLTLQLRHGLSSRARVRASNTFLKIDDPRIEEGGAILRADRSYIVNVFRGALNYDLWHLSNVDVSVHQQLRLYDDNEVARLSDKSEVGVGVAYRRTLSHTLRGLANIGYDSYSFKDDGIRSRDFDSITGSLGLEYVFTPLVIGSVSAGMQTRSYDSDVFATDDNLFVRGEISGALTHDLRVGLTAGVGVRDADVHPYPSQEYAELRWYADANLAPELALRVALTYRTSSYDAHPQLALAGGNEDVIVADAQVTYKVTEIASVLAGHRFEDVSADAGLSGEFTRNTTRVGMRVDF